jgi:hypothetical protein
LQPVAPINATPASKTEATTVRPITADFIVTFLTDDARRGFAGPYFREGLTSALVADLLASAMVATETIVQQFQK